ncbi:MAG: hypothetical protein FJW31_21465 [Acidobacteria bacterium]|nr:hypothetical protein [Acidobacteriota bacterium]
MRWLNAQGTESREGTESSVTPIQRTQHGDTLPSILSAPPTRGRTQAAFSYAPNVADPDAGEVLAWQITGAPTGMTQNATIGRLDWLPTAGQGGPYRLLLSVHDSRGRTATQAFTLFIETQLVNTPPMILSTAITSGSAGRAYSYSVRGTDADAGDVLTYLLDSGPAGMTLNSSTGLLQWTPAASGSFPVVLRVRDLAGAEARQAFTISVQNLNRGPQFTSAPPTTGAVNSSYAYASAATYPDAGDTLSWRLVTAPIGMGVNASTGLVFWTPAASQSGSHPVTLEVRDLLGATALQSWTIAVANGSSTNAPPVIATEPVTSARMGIPYSYDVNAIDVENQTVTYSLTTAPSGAAINPASGLIAWTPLATQVGVHDFVVRAADPLGQAAIQAFTVTVVTTPPATFELISPTLGADLSRPVNVVATITDRNAGGPALTWNVTLKRPGAADRTLATGTGTVSAGSIAALDPTTLPNDNYTVRVEIFKGTDGISREIPYTVSGTLKPGRLTASVTDLQIPITGIPLSVTRLYDSLDTRQGDFGAGWRLAYPGGVQDLPAESPLQGMKPGSKVYVTTPDGKRISFRFDPVAPSALFPYVVTPRFTPDAGATGTLTVAEPSVFLFDGVAYQDFNTPWNPSRYTYTAPTTVRYELDEIAGLQSIRDMNGNTLTFSAAGIVSSTGEALTLERDSAGRITRVREPGGAQLTYGYDAAGNLITATDQLGQTAR